MERGTFSVPPCCGEEQRVNSWAQLQGQGVASSGRRTSLRTSELLSFIIIIIKCMCSRCRRDDINVCFAYASPQRMPHMYNHKRVSLKYIK